MLHYHSQWCEKSDSFMQEAAVVWRRRPLRAFWRETLRARLRNGGAVKRRALSRTLRAAMSTPSALTVFIWRGRIWKRSTSDKLGLLEVGSRRIFMVSLSFLYLKMFFGGFDVEIQTGSGGKRRGGAELATKVTSPLSLRGYDSSVKVSFISRNNKWTV